MPKQTLVRTFVGLFFTMSMMLAPFATARAAESQRVVGGTTAGLFSPDPRWSAGIQLGNQGGTGVSAQNVGFAGGATNFGLGFADRGLAAHGDYLWFFNTKFERLKLKKKPAYNAIRGQITPYVGGGAQVGDGVTLRVPVGAQYTMLKDPFNFYSGLILMTGPFFADADMGIQLGIYVGTRVLL